jgi:hypothetical protein
MFAAHACSPNFKFKSHAINGKAANNTLEEIDELTDEQLVYEPDDEVADEAKTEDAAPTQPCEGLLRLKYVTVLCGWATHGIFCNCSGETVELPMPATDSNGTVQCVLPIKTMKSAEIEQEEYGEFYESTGETVELPMPPQPAPGRSGVSCTSGPCSPLRSSRRSMTSSTSPLPTTSMENQLRIPRVSVLTLLTLMINF